MQHRLSHLDVLIETAGFRISPVHPFIGAFTWWICFLQLLWFRCHRRKMVIWCKGPLCECSNKLCCRLLPWKRWARNHQTEAGPCILLPSTTPAVCYWQTILWFYPLDWKGKYFTFCGKCDTRSAFFDKVNVFKYCMVATSVMSYITDVVSSDSNSLHLLRYMYSSIFFNKLYIKRSCFVK